MTRHALVVLVALAACSAQREPDLSMVDSQTRTELRSDQVELEETRDQLETLETRIDVLQAKQRAAKKEMRAARAQYDAARAERRAARRSDEPVDEAIARQDEERSAIRLREARQEYRDATADLVMTEQAIDMLEAKEDWLRAALLAAIDEAREGETAEVLRQKARAKDLERTYRQERRALAELESRYRRGVQPS